MWQPGKLFQAIENQHPGPGHLSISYDDMLIQVDWYRSPDDHHIGCAGISGHFQPEITKKNMITSEYFLSGYWQD